MRPCFPRLLETINNTSLRKHRNMRKNTCFLFGELINFGYSSWAGQRNSDPNPKLIWGMSVSIFSLVSREGRISVVKASLKASGRTVQP